MRPTIRLRRAAALPGLAAAASLSLAACGYQPSLRDYRPVVDSYTTDMAAYEADRGQCVSVALQAQAEYERRQRAQRESNLTIGLIVGAIAGAAVGSATGDAGDGAIVGVTLGAMQLNQTTQLFFAVCLLFGIFPDQLTRQKAQTNSKRIKDNDDHSYGWGNGKRIFVRIVERIRFRHDLCKNHQNDCHRQCCPQHSSILKK